MEEWGYVNSAETYDEEMWKDFDSEEWLDQHQTRILFEEWF